MYEQLARATTARPSSGRATGRAVATFTPTNRYVDQAAAGSLRARAGVDGGVDSGVSIGSMSTYTTRYRPPVVVSNATLRERDWNNPNSPASRVKSCRTASPGGAPFVAQQTWQGARPGFVFKGGDLGLGYYHDAWFAAAAACYPTASGAPSGTAATTAEEEVVPVDPALREVLFGVMSNAPDQLGPGSGSDFEPLLLMTHYSHLLNVCQAEGGALARSEEHTSELQSP